MTDPRASETPDDAPHRALAEAEARYRSLVERIPAVVYVCDFDAGATFRYVSPQVEDLLGYPPEELLADDDLWYRCIHPDDLPRVLEAEAAAYERRGEFDCEFRMIRRDGRVVHVWERDAIVEDAEGRPLMTQGVVVDVTDLREAEAGVRDERDRAQRYLDVAGTVLLALDAEGRVTMLNRAGHRLLGYQDAELVGADWFATCIPPSSRDHLRELFDQALAGEEILPQWEATVVCRDGRERALVWDSSLLVEEGGVVGMMSAGIDVTERRRAEEQVAYLAYHDSLTGLPNRMMLQEHLELALARARRNRGSVALMFIDLDDFKLVNDGLGHAAGDELLCQVAARLRRQVRESDTLARQGGDEFLILLGDLDDEPTLRAVAAAEHIAEAIREPFRLGGTEFDIGASIGISIFPVDAHDADTLLEHADSAMYDAKAAGRGGVRVYGSEPLRRERGVERLSLSRKLRRAIGAGELVLHWQPVVGLPDRVISGAEALVRWEDPEHGLRAAGEFVPVAERRGLLDELDEWVIDAFSAQRRLWQAQGFDPWVGFNLSPRQLRPERIDGMLAALRTGGSLDRVTIELTESVVLREDAGTGAVIDALCDAGVTLCLDDFGVAYSSLSRLADLPVGWIKVDRSFLREVPGSHAATSLLNSILGLVGALGLNLIVEGVETEAHVDHLVAQGCQRAQGYLLGAPMPASELEPLLRASPVSWSPEGP